MKKDKQGAQYKSFFYDPRTISLLYCYFHRKLFTQQTYEDHYIGGVAGGATTAARIRRTNEAAKSSF